MMKRIATKATLTLLATAAVLFTFAIPAIAAPNGTDHLGPFAASTNDGGSCGNEWAQDSYTITLGVHDNGNGTFALRVDYKNGTFVTFAGASPGACSSVNNHGTTLTAGANGNFQGWLSETISGGTFNSNGCAAANCSTRTDAITALFGSGASQSNFTYNFEYSSNDKSLKYHHWQDKLTGGDVSDVFVGDIGN